MRSNAAAAAAIMLLAALLSLGAPAAAFAIEDDAGLPGSVVEVGDDVRGHESSNSDDGEHASAGSPSTQAAAPEVLQEAPKPLDDEGNVINEGQVSDSSFLYDAAIADLAEADSYYDGQTVQVTGEAVGEAIYADSKHSWISLLDTEADSSVAVYMFNYDLGKIDVYGAYDKTGTTLRVQGIYHLACPEHDGESDIHAAVVNVAALGAVLSESVDVQDFIPGIILTAAGALLTALFWRMRERSR